MDWTAVKNKTLDLFRQYRYVVLVLLIGLVLMLLPESAEETVEAAQNPTEPAVSVSEELESILSQIEGVGKVRVMLTENTGGEIIYQTDEDRDQTADSQSVRVETVIVTDSDRAQQGLVKQVNPPVWLGAIVVCQGADRPVVQLNIVEAVSNVTGISTDRITVLKMK